MGRTVLIVEDNLRIAAMLAKGLYLRGLDVETATTGADAVARVAAGGIDLPLLDLGLPDTDGWHVLRELRDLAYTGPVIIMTAGDSCGAGAAAHGLDVTAYFTKPFRWADLWAAIEVCLSEAHRR